MPIHSRTVWPRLTGDEQKAVKTTAFDLQLNPANPGMKLHKLDRAKDPNFWSVRVSSDIRIIVHKTESSLLLCFVDHHDNAYDWAERRKLETHPKTGAAQLVEIRETIREITVPKYVEVEKKAPHKPPLFADVSKDDLLSYGVPAEWLDDVRKANEDTVLELADHLPSEAAEALLDFATGVIPQKQPAIYAKDPFEHPDAQRRFRVMHDVEELERALEFPWEKWTVFLHPAQRQFVERDYSGPARVSGSAGTGKTIVALHRAVFLARRIPMPGSCSPHFPTPWPMPLNEAKTIDQQRTANRRAPGSACHRRNWKRLYESNFGRPDIAPREVIQQLLEEAAKTVQDHKFTTHFLMTEWEQVVDAWQLETWEAYRDVRRLGRKTRLKEKQRVMLWSIFDHVRSRLKDRGMVTENYIFSRLASQLTESKHQPFNFVVVDEAQDVSISQLRFLAALTSEQPSHLFFAGDLGQRIFQQPFSWKSLGVDIRGRSHTLRINYRTSHQIRIQADRLLAPTISDVDGIGRKAWRDFGI